jgi:uncharacterized phiE125 gp8 family phage protein
VGNVVTVEPTAEPVTAAEVMRHARIEELVVDTTADVQLMITAARQRVENEFLWRALITQTRKQTLDAWPADDTIELAYPPLQSVSGITYVDSNGATQTLSSSVYDMTTTGFLGKVTLAYAQTWPINRGDVDSIQVTYVAGYGDAASDVPAVIRLAIRQSVAHWLENREPIVMGTIVAKIPDVAQRTLDAYCARQLV